MDYSQPSVNANVFPYPPQNQPMQNGLNSGEQRPVGVGYASPFAVQSPDVQQLTGSVQKMGIGQDHQQLPSYSMGAHVPGPKSVPYSSVSCPSYLPQSFTQPVEAVGPHAIPKSSDPYPQTLGVHMPSFSTVPPIEGQFSNNAMTMPATTQMYTGVGYPMSTMSNVPSPMSSQAPPSMPPNPHGLDNMSPMGAVPPMFSSNAFPPMTSQPPTSMPTTNVLSAHPPIAGTMPPPTAAAMPPFPQMPMSQPMGMIPPSNAQSAQFPPAVPSGPMSFNRADKYPTAPTGMPPMPPSMPTQMTAPAPGCGAPAYPPGIPGATTMDSGAGGTTKRLDPQMMPSLIQVVEDDRRARGGLFQSGVNHSEQPPLATTDFYCEDQGNCNPKFIRSSLYAVPMSNDFVKQSAIPMSLSIVPLANLSGEESPLPIVDTGDKGPLRCHRCKAYICPFMMFFDGGRQFRCSFCTVSTSVPEYYFAHLDHTGRRIDAMERPELHLGSYEYTVTEEYCKDSKLPKPPVFVFMLDVSYNAVRSGLVKTMCENVKMLLHSLPKDYGGDSTMEVAFVTYDHSVHFYDLKSGNGMPKMMVVSDVQEVFVPTGKNLFVKPSEAGPTIDRLMEKIWSMFNESRTTDVVLGPVLMAGVEMLKAYGRVGKLFVFHTSLPTYEAPGKLLSRDDRKLLGTDKEKSILLPQGKYYSKLAEECVSLGCCVDVFLFPNAHVDVATISSVCSMTGGQVYKYPFFEAENDMDRFLADLKHDIERPIVFDAVLKVRASQGLRATDFLGNFYMSNMTDVELAAIDSDKCITVEIKHDDKLEPGLAFFQVALLFTSASGQRRLRVHNLALATAPDFPVLYRSADLFSMVNLMCKQVQRQLLQKSAKEVREGVVNKTAQSLATYRQKCSPSSSLGQLVLPEAMKLLPLLVNCVFKNDSFVGGSELTVDDRAWLMHIVPSMTVEQTVNYFYPNLIPVIDMDSAVESAPASIRCSYDNLQSDQAYLLENGILLFIWVGTNAPAQWIQDVFGVNTFAQINAEKHHLPEKDNPASRTLRCLIESTQAPRQRRMKLFIVKQQDRLEVWFKKFLVEDRTDNHQSYVEFLCYIHKEIRNLLT